MGEPRTTLSGRPPETPETPGAPASIDPATGMYKDYWVLPPEELVKGFIRPLRLGYQHKVCGSVTTMALKIAETYARDPGYYESTFCAVCRDHYPVGDFVWDGTDEVLGS